MGGVVSFVVVVNDVRYIDPVVVAPAQRRIGLGRSVVLRSLQSLASVGETEVRAVITDGNVPSERLFGALGFRRIGTWG